MKTPIKLTCRKGSEIVEMTEKIKDGGNYTSSIGKIEKAWCSSGILWLGSLSETKYKSAMDFKGKTKKYILRKMNEYLNS